MPAWFRFHRLILWEQEAQVSVKVIAGRGSKGCSGVTSELLAALLDPTWKGTPGPGQKINARKGCVEQQAPEGGTQTLASDELGPAQLCHIQG